MINSTHFNQVEARQDNTAPAELRTVENCHHLKTSLSGKPLGHFRNFTMWLLSYSWLSKSKRNPVSFRN